MFKAWTNKIKNIGPGIIRALRRFEYVSVNKIYSCVIWPEVGFISSAFKIKHLTLHNWIKQKHLVVNNRFIVKDNGC